MAGPLEDANAAYDRGDYATTLRLLRPLAEQGDASVERKLGALWIANAVPQDYIAAATWFRKAAEQGEAKAQVGLGFIYFSGLGVAEDYSEALKWFLKAQEQGNADA
jgi:uncharacterized protein